jgi:hypothetical protein
MQIGLRSMSLFLWQQIKDLQLVCYYRLFFKMDAYCFILHV